MWATILELLLNLYVAAQHCIETGKLIYIYIYIYIYMILVFFAGLYIEEEFPEFNLISFLYSVTKNLMFTCLFTKLNSCNRSM